MTLSSAVKDPLEAELRIKVSQHVACTWTWGIEHTFAEDESVAGYYVVLRKKHPLFELAQEVLSHLPEHVNTLVRDSAFYERLVERYSVDVARIPVPDVTARELWPPLWEFVEEWNADDDG